MWEELQIEAERSTEAILKINNVTICLDVRRWKDSWKIVEIRAVKVNALTRLINLKKLVR